TRSPAAATRPWPGSRRRWPTASSRGSSCATTTTSPACAAIRASRNSSTPPAPSTRSWSRSGAERRAGPCPGGAPGPGFAAMFIGHFAMGFAAKRVVPGTPLGAHVLAPTFLDVLWPFFLVLGLEHVRIDPGNTAFTPLDLHDYPFSHSLFMSVVWSALFGAV